jgi:hypothetical protein
VGAYHLCQDGTICVVNRGAEHPDAPRSEDFVRAEILMGANIIQPMPGHPDKTIFSMVTQVDPVRHITHPHAGDRASGRAGWLTHGMLWSGCGWQGGFAPPVIVNKISSLGPVSFFSKIEAAAKREPPPPGAQGKQKTEVTF